MLSPPCVHNCNVNTLLPLISLLTMLYVHILYVECTPTFMYSGADPEDLGEARRYRVPFRLTRTSDQLAPLEEAESEPIVLNINNDANYKGDVVFTFRIVSTSDAPTVRIGPRNEVPVTIVDDDSKLSHINCVCLYT